MQANAPEDVQANAPEVAHFPAGTREFSHLRSTSKSDLLRDTRRRRGGGVAQSCIYCMVCFSGFVAACILIRLFIFHMTRVDRPSGSLPRPFPAKTWYRRDRTAGLNEMVSLSVFDNNVTATASSSSSSSYSSSSEDDNDYSKPLATLFEVCYRAEQGCQSVTHFHTGWAPCPSPPCFPYYLSTPTLTRSRWPFTPSFL